MNRSVFLNYWGKMFGLSSASIGTSTPAWTTRGRYVKSHGDKYIFYFHDPRSKKNIISGSEKKLVRLQREITDLDRLRPHKLPPALNNRKLAFADIDFVLQKRLKKIRHNKEVRALTHFDHATVRKFLRSCSAEDRDTLDLRLKEDKAFGVFLNGKLAGIARYAKIPRAPKIADITVLVHRRHRGKGLSTPLVYELCKDILRRKLIPKYRVGENNLASIAIARRLGFKVSFYIYSFRS